ncbi:cellulose binding domain-containing protein [Streptacidiphilus monticola]|uniref:Cellulose binding domain-containing protein n=1 Tax=Streptacidiphilus monticola TaxID=2161674 RepID=A0ABW1GAY9_9ACTN
MHRKSRRRVVFAAGVATVLALPIAGLLVTQGADASNTVAINVNASQNLGIVPSIANGVNTATFDGHLNDSAATAALAGAGVDALRYPGGSTADAYRWQTNTTVDGLGYANPANGFDDFMGIARKIGASPVITVNYGSGTAAEAAAWVRYANVTKHYGVKYWELGNEIPGDGTYGSMWEHNLKPKGATAYANNIADYITEMKAADPSIKVGAVLTLHNSWPDGLVASKYGDTADWNTTVLKKDGPKLDFVILHYYPTSKSEADLLTQYRTIASIVQATRAEITKYAGSNAAKIQIMITETDAGFESDSVPAALYTADSYMTFLQNKVQNIDWWDEHNGPSNITTLPDGSTDYGDGGILSAGGCAGSVCEPAANTPFPAYYGLKAVGAFAAPGARMVRATTSNSTVTAYAVRTSSGLNLLLVNHSAKTSEPVSISYAGFNPANVTSAQQFSEANKKLQQIPGVKAHGLTLPAYSITVLKLANAGAAPIAATSCTVTTGNSVSWRGGYTENVRITNTGSKAASAWKVTFGLPAHERLTASWNATHTQRGNLVTLRPVDYDRTIAAGATLPFGFTASDSGTAARPTWYALNGVRCNGH